MRVRVLDASAFLIAERFERAEGAIATISSSLALSRPAEPPARAARMKLRPIRPKPLIPTRVTMVPLRSRLLMPPVLQGLSAPSRFDNGPLPLPLRHPPTTEQEHEGVVKRDEADGRGDEREHPGEHGGGCQ